MTAQIATVVLFSSLLGVGTNVALFDLASAGVVDRGKFQTSILRHEFYVG